MSVLIVLEDLSARRGFAVGKAALYACDDGLADVVGPLHGRLDRDVLRFSECAQIFRRFDFLKTRHQSFAAMLGERDKRGEAVRIEIFGAVVPVLRFGRGCGFPGLPGFDGRLFGKRFRKLWGHLPNEHAVHRFRQRNRESLGRFALKRRFTPDVGAKERRHFVAGPELFAFAHVRRFLAFNS
jgi:hypothetical protein